MKRVNKKRRFFWILLVAALIIAVGGIGKFHANPFTFTLKTNNPTALVIGSSGTPRAVADRFGSVLMIMNDDGRLQRTVKVNNADHPHDRITMLYVEDESIYANVITVENQHVAREQIRLYNQSGKCVSTIIDNVYTDDIVFGNQNQLFIRDEKEVSVVRIEDNVLKTISLCENGATVTDSVCLSEPIIEVKQGSGPVLYVSSLYGKMYEYVPGSGCAKSVSLSDKDYIDILMEKTLGATSIAYSPLYAVVNILFWLSLSILGTIIIFFAYRFFRYRYNKTIGVVIAVVLLAAGIVAFYTYHIFRQTKTELTQMMIYQTELLAYVTEHNYMGLVQTLSACNTDSCLMQPHVVEQLTDLHTILAKSSQYNGNEYYVAIAYKGDSIARQLVDNMNKESTGRPAYLVSSKWDMPDADGTDIVLTAYNEQFHCTARNVRDHAGKIVAKIISVFPERLLRFNQREKAFGQFLSLLSILIGVYTLFTFVNAIRRSFSEYARRRREALPYAKEQLFPTFYSLIVWFREVDRSLMVFIIPYFAAGGSIGDVASVTAIVLMVYSIGSVVMVPFTKMAYTRFGIRNVGIAILLSALLIGVSAVTLSGISPLMLSNIMVIGLAMNLLLRKPLNDYYASIGTRRSLIVQAAVISAALLMLAVSPNIIWMTVICLIIYVLKMNSCVVLYQVEVIERNGFKQQDVQSDCLLADQILRTVRMPFINMLVQAGRISACV